jgi:glutamate dehydrogenase (NAD(P)+)
MLYAGEQDASHGKRSVRISAPDGAALGFLEIDRVVAGRCCGGVRASADVTQEELRRIAEVMTLKCGFVGLAAGGAKGGIVMPTGASPEERAERLVAYGRALGQLLRSGVWSHGVDLGTTMADLALIRRGAGLEGARVTTIPPADARARHSSSAEPAGLTVALSAEAALESLRICARGARVAIQGAGAVGRAALAALARAGARIVAVATVAGTLHRDEGLDAALLLEGLARSGDGFLGGTNRLSPLAVLEVDCDALLSCAVTASIDASVAARMRAGTVICGANTPFADGAQDALAARGILVLPDFIAGAGGVLGSTLETAAGAGPEEVESILRRRFKPLVTSTIAAAAARGDAPAVEAGRRALRVLAACDLAYRAERPPTLLPDRLAPEASLAARACLALEHRLRGSTRLAPVVRGLHRRALARAEQVLCASLEAGARSA